MTQYISAQRMVTEVLQGVLMIIMLLGCEGVRPAQADGHEHHRAREIIVRSDLANGASIGDTNAAHGTA